MSKKRESYEIRKIFLLKLNDGPLSPSELERKLNTNAATIKNNKKELETYGFIFIKKKKHPSNNRLYEEISLTEEGKRIVKKLKEE